MSDSDNKPKIPPPDDFSKTTPNINFDDDGAGDWDKTNYGSNIPSQTPADDWGKTVINYDVSSIDDDDDDNDAFKNTSYSKNAPKQPDWGMTQANINLNAEFESDDLGEADESFGKTTPYFRLPEAEREKYQQLPLTPTEKAQQDEKEKREKGGIPAWFWISAVLMTFFAFTVLGLVAAYFIFSGSKGFDVIVKDIEAGSIVFVDGSQYGVPSTSNQIRIRGLEAGKRTIQVIKPGNVKCQADEIEGKDYDDPITYSPKDCKAAPVVDTSNQDCEKTLNEDTREACAEEILDGLSNPPDLERLLRALKLLRINFAKDSSELPGRNKRILKKAAGHIKNLPKNVVLEVGGHTDSDGSYSYNESLSDRRAKAVYDFFLANGIEKSRMTSKGYGEKDPVADNNTEDGKARNRRIDYKAVQ